jgi:RluA family pseudouridine synthase
VKGSLALAVGSIDLRNTLDIAKRQAMSNKPANVIKLSSPATRQYWEVPVLFEDDHLLALNKPPLLLTSPDRDDPSRPNLMKLLHQDIECGAIWVKARPALSYLMNAHRLDFETSGVILLAKSKPVLVALANLFGSEKPIKIYVALVQGAPKHNSFQVEAKLAPHPLKRGLMRVDHKRGKRSRTEIEIRERFVNHTLLACRPRTARMHQIRVHLQHIGLPIVGDPTYGGSPLLLSRLKSDYHLKPNATERPLISSTALHAEELSFAHPVNGTEVTITAPWPKDFAVAVKYLRRYSPG